MSAHGHGMAAMPCASAAFGGSTHLIDGSFDGLLTSVFDAYESKRFPERIYESGDYQQDLTRTPADIRTDAAKAARVQAGIMRRIGGEAFDQVWMAYLSDDRERFIKVFRYLALGFMIGRKALGNLTEPAIMDVFELARRVGRETNHMLGFLRFSVMDDGVQYAAIAPACNQTPCLAPHFAGRMPDIPFVIHDTRRRIAAIYDTKDIAYADTGGVSPVKGFSEDERAFRELWRCFYGAIAIKERINPKLQRSLMPKRYWKNMTEHNNGT
jgi:probable DNA metabolism protein